MLRIKRLTRDYTAAGSVNHLLALWGFVDDHTFLTKAGHVGVVYAMAGVDYECLDHGQRRDVVHRFEAAVRMLDDTCRVYQYLVKRRTRPRETTPCRNPIVQEVLQRRDDHLNSRCTELYDISLYLV